MKFAIATVEYFQSKGFNTESWRKNHDESLAIVHLEFALALISDVSELKILRHPSLEFDEYMSSEEWAGAQINLLESEIADLELQQESYLETIDEIEKINNEYPYND